MNRKMAQPVVDDGDPLEILRMSEEGALMVVSADGKGVPIRRGARVSPSENHQPFQTSETGNQEDRLGWRHLYRGPLHEFQAFHIERLYPHTDLTDDVERAIVAWLGRARATRTLDSLMGASRSRTGR